MLCKQTQGAEIIYRVVLTIALSIRLNLDMSKSSLESQTAMYIVYTHT